MVSEAELGTKEQDIMKFCRQFSDYSNEQLFFEIEKYDSNSSVPERIAASLVLDQRKQDEEKAKHAELLAEIKRPHWSTTYLFWVSVVGMLAACVAAYFAIFPVSQPASLVNQPAAAVPPSATELAQKQSPPSQPVQQPSVKK